MKKETINRLVICPIILFLSWLPILFLPPIFVWLGGLLGGALVVASPVIFDN